MKATTSTTSKKKKNIVKRDRATKNKMKANPLEHFDSAIYR